MADAVPAQQRFTKLHPCPICGGHSGMAPGKDMRCYGFMSSDGEYVHCTRPERAGPLDQYRDETYVHKFKGECNCGVQHNPEDFHARPPVNIKAARQARGHGSVERAPDKEYVYLDERGTPIALKGRWNYPDGSKDIRWRVPTGTYHDGITASGLSVENLPLYNAQRLAKLPPGSTIWLVEGEKAADACEEVGLVDWKQSGVTTVAGGAHQADFGTSLELLHGHHIRAWHDNDADGRKLMRTLHGKLLHDVLTWKPVIAPVPPKGDAYDYFFPKDGSDFPVGTVEALLSSHTSETVCEIVDEETIRVRVPTLEGPTVVVTFSEIERKRREIHAVLHTALHSPTGSSKKSTQYDIDLLSTSKVTDYRRMLENTFPELGDPRKPSDTRWQDILNEAISQMMIAYAAIGEFFDSGDLDPSESDDMAYAIEPFVPLGEHIIIFGRRDSTKSYIALTMCCAASMGLDWAGNPTHSSGAWLYLDNETSLRNWRRRAKRVWRGFGYEDDYPKGKVFYLHMRGRALVDMIDTLLPLIRRYGIVGIVCDSAIMACAGDPKEPGPAADYCRATAKLGVTFITIAHIPKDIEKDPDDPFGSIVWSNHSRATLRVKRSTTDPEASVVVASIKPTKGNDLESKQPVFVQTVFDGRGGPVRVESFNYRHAPSELQSERKLPQRIWDALGLSALSARDIAEKMHTPNDEDLKRFVVSVADSCRRQAKDDGPLPRLTSMPSAGNTNERVYGRAALGVLPGTPRIADEPPPPDGEEDNEPVQLARAVGERTQTRSVRERFIEAPGSDLPF